MTAVRGGVINSRDGRAGRGFGSGNRPFSYMDAAVNGS